MDSFLLTRNEAVFKLLGRPYPSISFDGVSSCSKFYAYCMLMYVILPKICLSIVAKGTKLFLLIPLFCDSL